MSRVQAGWNARRDGGTRQHLVRCRVCGARPGRLPGGEARGQAPAAIDVPGVAKNRRGGAALLDDDHPADDAREWVSLQQNEIDPGPHSPTAAVAGVPGHGMGPGGEGSLVQQAEAPPGGIVDGEAVMSLASEMEAQPRTDSRRVGNDVK